MADRPHPDRSPAELVERFGTVLARFPDVARRQMFGYPAAFVGGNMATGLHGARWIVRLGDADQVELRGRGGQAFEPMPGRPMRGFLVVPEDVVADDAAIDEWVGRAVACAAAMPPKPDKAKGRG
jgi:hypothetical protein